MATAKITVTVDADQLKKIRQRVRKQKGQTVAGFVRESIQSALDNDGDLAFQKLLDDMFAQTGGPPTAEEQDWAAAVLDGKRPGKLPKRRKVA